MKQIVVSQILRLILIQSAENATPCEKLTVMRLGVEFKDFYIYFHVLVIQFLHLDC